MIVDERMVTYINSLDMGNTPLLNEIEREAKADLVPVIRREMQSFLKVLLAIHRPLRVLEGRLWAFQPFCSVSMVLRTCR